MSLAELRAAHESVCSEFSALKKRAAELESAGEELRRQLALAQEATRGLERDKTELTSEIVAVRAEIANLESQLAQGAAHGRALSEANQILVDHANSADKRIVELQSEGALMREKLLFSENDKHSLQTALDQTLAETSRLSRRLTESENALTAARARLEQMDISLAAAENERATLATARERPTSDINPKPTPLICSSRLYVRVPLPRRNYSPRCARPSSLAPRRSGARRTCAKPRCRASPGRSPGRS